MAKKNCFEHLRHCPCLNYKKNMTFFSILLMKRCIDIFLASNIKKLSDVNETKFIYSLYLIPIKRLLTKFQMTLNCPIHNGTF